ncbi:MAG: collagen-like protein, partial [Acidobacteria bacterium]|nr:collagen-like protein [Acidobacteriota bacterium]
MSFLPLHINGSGQSNLNLTKKGTTMRNLLTKKGTTMRNLRKTTYAILLVLAVALMAIPPTTLHSQGQNKPKQKKKVAVLRQQNQPASPPTAQEVADSDRGKLAQAEKVRAFKSGRDLLRAKGVPFEPNILLEPDWREKLKHFLARMPEMRKELFHSSILEGAQLADVFRLPEKVQLKGDTVIIANRIVFDGKNVSIKGNHAIHFFALNSIGTANGGGTVTIDTSGLGRKEWLEQQQNKAGQRSAKSKESPRRSTERGGFFMAKASYSHALIVNPAMLQNGDGQPGADGAMGQFGYAGGSGTSSYNGANGSCGGDLNGQPGGDGGWGGDGTDGQRGGDGSSGEDARPITLTITDPNDTSPYVVTARGGAGGQGGQGGYGGQGGSGGNGGNGGNGAVCAGCQLGSGGSGGTGGIGGDGGAGGDGGTGGNGGAGNVITINYPSGYDISRISADAGGGAAGSGGNGGLGGTAGFGGSGGSNGSGGSAIGCGSGNNGNPGQRGSDGRGGAHGDPGSPGSPGNP